MMRIQQNIGRITFFYHASAESHPANRRDFFNTHIPITLTTPASARLCAVGACNPKTDPVSLATKDGETFEDVEIFF